MELSRVMSQVCGDLVIFLAQSHRKTKSSFIIELCIKRSQDSGSVVTALSSNKKFLSSVFNLWVLWEIRHNMAGN